MKKQLVSIGILTLLFCVGLSGCNSNTAEKNKFIGTWSYKVPNGYGVNYSFTYYFFSNGNFSFHKPNLITNGTFDVNVDGKLALINDKYNAYYYMFSENNTKLTIDGTTYIKQ